MQDSGIIRSVVGSQRLDSRGKPTVKVIVTTDKGRENKLDTYNG